MKGSERKAIRTLVYWLGEFQRGCDTGSEGIASGGGSMSRLKRIELAVAVMALSDHVEHLDLYSGDRGSSARQVKRLGEHEYECIGLG